MEMSGLVYLFSLFVLNKGIMLLLINNFMYVMCYLPSAIFIFGCKFPFYFMFRMAGWREASPQPSTSGVSRER